MLSTSFLAGLLTAGILAVTWVAEARDGINLDASGPVGVMADAEGVNQAPAGRKNPVSAMDPRSGRPLATVKNPAEQNVRAPGAVKMPKPDSAPSGDTAAGPERRGKPLPRKPARTSRSAGLRPGTKELFVPTGSVRTTDAAGNALIKLPDGGQVRLMKDGRVEILGPSGRTIERGRFVGWQDKAGMRAGGRMGVRAGERMGVRAEGRMGLRAGGRMGVRAGERAIDPAPIGQHLIYR